MGYTLNYTLINNNTAYEVTGYTGEPVGVVIPSTYNGKPVTSIGDCAFEGCSSLTNVVIDYRVTSIGEYAFSNCSSLTRVAIGNSVESIGEGAFENCSILTNISVSEDNEHYQSIDGNLYSKDGRTLIQYAIGKTATSFTIPDSVTSIGTFAFEHCTSLTSVVIPDSVTTIEGWGFSYCNSLTSIEIPDSVTSIGNFAFNGCNSLKRVVIPNRVTSIGNNAFTNCSSLNEVIVLGSTPPNISSPFPSSVQIYCYAQTLNTYKNATSWSAYSLMANDMKLYFVMNARAQKRYFLAKNELGDLHFENNYIHWTGDPYGGIKIGMAEMDLQIRADRFQLYDGENHGGPVLSYDGPNEEFYIHSYCQCDSGLMISGDASIQGELTIGNGSLYSTSSEIYISPASQDNYLRISDDDELIELRANSDGATISLITEGSTDDTRIELHSVSPSADSKIRLGPEGGSFWGYDIVTILSTHDSYGNINSQSDGARLLMDVDGRIAFTAFGSESTTFTWNGNPILTKANFKLTGTNNDILEITV